MSAEELLGKLRSIKYLLKRLEYDSYEKEDIFNELCGEYSVYAVAAVYEEYVTYKEDVFKKILRYYQSVYMDAQADIWMKKGQHY